MLDFLSSSIGKKVIMSLSGLFLLVFLALHAAINLTALFSETLYNQACEFMGSGFVLPFVPVLALGFIVHILVSLRIEFQNWNCRPNSMRYRVPTQTKASSWASKNMLALGVIVLGLLAIHFFHFWSKMQLPELLGNHGAKNPRQLIINLFQNPVWCVVYIAWFVAIFYHVSHGFWSAFQSLGLNNSKWLPRLQYLAKIYAVVIFLAYAAIPVCFLTGCSGDKWAVGCEEAPACVATEEAADVEEATAEEAEATTDAEEATAE
ncbi:MAG: succinate dehydrogenase cytochrome b subunit [Thermoguttaceae bacterium]|nr:succinate dehydrogenase cytochrome b subunit [Thermoguttaceae bacterium]